MINFDENKRFVEWHGAILKGSTTKYAPIKLPAKMGERDIYWNGQLITITSRINGPIYDWKVDIIKKALDALKFPFLATSVLIDDKHCNELSISAICCKEYGIRKIQDILPGIEIEEYKGYYSTEIVYDTDEFCCDLQVLFEFIFVPETKTYDDYFTWDNYFYEKAKEYNEITARKQ